MPDSTVIGDWEWAQEPPPRFEIFVKITVLLCLYSATSSKQRPIAVAS